MGFGLPSALGAAAAFDGKNGRESRVVIDIDGDGSFLMNCQVGGIWLEDIALSRGQQVFLWGVLQALRNSSL